MRSRRSSDEVRNGIDGVAKVIDGVGDGIDGVAKVTDEVRNGTDAVAKAIDGVRDGIDRITARTVIGKLADASRTPADCYTGATGLAAKAAPEKNQ